MSSSVVWSAHCRSSTRRSVGPRRASASTTAGDRAERALAEHVRFERERVGDVGRGEPEHVGEEGNRVARGEAERGAGFLRAW